jgi:hypothetical protein
MKQKKKRISWGGVALLVCGLLALTGFLASQSTKASATTPAFVRIIHASPFVGTADVFLDGSPLLTSFAFGAVTGYAAIPAGPHKVQIALVGKGIGASALTETLTTQPGTVYTVAAIGTSPQNLSLEVFVDNNSVVSGTAKVRVYQLSPNGGSMNVTSGGQALVPTILYQQASNYFTMPEGSRTFDLASSQNGKSLSIATTLKTNTVTSIFEVGMFNGSPQAELVTTQVAAVPGLPETGSNPFAFLSDGQLSTPWLLIVIATLFVGGTLFTRRLFAGH